MTFDRCQDEKWVGLVFVLHAAASILISISLAMSSSGAFLYSVVVVLAAWMLDSGHGTPLDDYVNKPDASYEFRDLGVPVKMDNYTVHYINMTSQTWLSDDIVTCSEWWHTLAITIPDYLPTTDTAFIYITGGSNSNSDLPEVTDEDILLSSIVSFSTGMVTASLFQIPNQPCVFSEDDVMHHKSRTEDAVIAYTWYHYFLHPDQPEYLLRLPMTKAVVRAMDTVAAFIQSKMPHNNITKFLIAGASKRGWTTWTTAVVDKRVIAMIPMVEDALNLQKNLHHMYRAYGGWTFAFDDYMDLNITAYLDEPTMQDMAAIIDPYAYRDRMTMPKLLINAGGDEFFMPDDNHYFWDDLPGPKYFRLVPNAEHSLATGLPSILFCIRAFALSIVMNAPLPKMSWTLNNTVDGGSITFMTDTKPSDVRVFHATTLTSTRRDFRWLIGTPDPKNPTLQPVLWFSEPLSPTQENNGYTYVAKMPVPDMGWTAFVIQALYPGPKDSELEFTTQVNIIPNTFPFPDCHGRDCLGKLV